MLLSYCKHCLVSSYKPFVKSFLLVLAWISLFTAKSLAQFLWGKWVKQQLLVGVCSVGALWGLESSIGISFLHTDLSHLGWGLCLPGREWSGSEVPFCNLNWLLGSRANVKSFTSNKVIVGFFVCYLFQITRRVETANKLKSRVNLHNRYSNWIGKLITQKV